jgi:hypothetical protein
MSDGDIVTRLRGYCAAAPHDTLACESLAEIERLLVLWTEQTAARAKAEREVERLRADVEAFRAEVFNQVARVQFLRTDSAVCRAHIYDEVKEFDTPEPALAWLREMFDASWPRKV